MQYYFFETVSEGGRIRMHPLKGQFLSNGSEAIDPKAHVSVPSGMKSFRESFPVGTVFASSSITPQQNAGGKLFYRSGNLTAVSSTMSDWDVRDAWIEYQDSLKNPLKKSPNRELIERLEAGIMKFYIPFGGNPTGKTYFGTRNVDIVTQLCGGFFPVKPTDTKGSFSFFDIQNKEWKIVMDTTVCMKDLGYL